jgi:ATP-dependent Lon protease
MSHLNDPEEDDPDYEPDEDEDNTSDEYEEENEEDEEDESDKNIIIYFDQFVRNFPPPPPPRAKRSRFEEGLSNEEALYFKDLPEDKKQKVLDNENQLRISTDKETKIPLKFKILESDMDPSAKRLLLSKLDHFQRMNEGSSEYFKLRNWLNAASRLPLGIYNKLPVSHADPVSQIAEFLTSMRTTLDTTVYGHAETKDHIMRIFAQWIANPSSKGNVIGIQGPMGCGKTSLVKDGICKALGMPFGFIALGGAADGSFLDGHSFTYEGSMYGKVAEVLMKTGVMNPIFFFDELDKISQSHRGEEVTGILMHLTDSSQNERFNDKYFAEIDLDLSKALVIFSYNDESLVNPILKDRMITVRVSGYTRKDKIKIATKHLIPSILAQFGLCSTDVIFTPQSIERIIERVAEEDGVRNLKRGIETIVSWLNISRFVNVGNIAFPFEVTESHVDKQLKMASCNTRSHPPHSMYL